jgi:hypothetical protein
MISELNNVHKEMGHDWYNCLCFNTSRSGVLNDTQILNFKANLGKPRTHEARPALITIPKPSAVIPAREASSTLDLQPKSPTVVKLPFPAYARSPERKKNNVPPSDASIPSVYDSPSPPKALAPYSPILSSSPKDSSESPSMSPTMSSSTEMRSRPQDASKGPKLYNNTR